ncbi:MAG: helix-turn-helix transcriptional regulator [Proteobacteria bacterium]|nr:helix-turn-helix transcriptional regulator [Pseudomonadota bacterium]
MTYRRKTRGQPKDDQRDQAAREARRISPANVEIDGVAYVILPEADYQYLAAEAEMANEVGFAEGADRRLETGDDELVPFNLLTRILAGDNPIRVWREYRCLTQGELADRAGVDRSHLSRLEARETGSGNAVTLRKLADALGCAIDNLVPPRSDGE